MLGLLACLLTGLLNALKRHQSPPLRQSEALGQASVSSGQHGLVKTGELALIRGSISWGRHGWPGCRSRRKGTGVSSRIGGVRGRRISGRRVSSRAGDVRALCLVLIRLGSAKSHQFTLQQPDDIELLCSRHETIDLLQNLLLQL